VTGCLATFNIVTEDRPDDDVERDVQHALKREKDSATGKEASANQFVDVDLDTYRVELQDMALTCFNFMIANQSKGTYHDNFDISQAFFKWMVAFKLVYPVWCQEMQEKKEQGELGRDELDFWDAALKKPTREAILI
jgi:hypothetical protein